MSGSWIRSLEHQAISRPHDRWLSRAKTGEFDPFGRTTAIAVYLPEIVNVVALAPSLNETLAVGSPGEADHLRGHRGQASRRAGRGEVTIQINNHEVTRSRVAAVAGEVGESMAVRRKRGIPMSYWERLTCVSTRVAPLSVARR